MKINRVYYFNSNITFLQDFFSGETDFYFHQFLSNFFKYFFSNFLLFYLYNIFTIYFPGNSLLLKSYSFTKSNFSYLLTFVLIFFLNLATTFFVFCKSFFFSHVLYFTINLFYCIKYFTTSLIFILFNIFLTFHSLTPFTSISFSFSTFCLSTNSLYLTT